MAEFDEPGGSATTPDGAELRWRELGSGEPLLLVNGYAAAKADWDPGFLERLGAHSRVICPDNRGIGESTTGSEPISVERLMADAVVILDALGIDRAPVAGWSMGGFVTQMLVAEHPERVAAAVLIGTHPGGEITTNAERGVFQTLIDHSGSPREQASRLIGLLFPGEQARRIDEQFGDVVAAARASLDEATLFAQEQLMVDWHGGPSEDRLHAIAGSGVPVLCAHGAEDVVVPAANSDAISARVPGAWKAIFAGAGHAVMASEPERLAELIGVFLDRR